MWERCTVKGPHMKTIKRFIVWVNYGLEGWSIFGSSDDWDEAVSIRSEAIDECNIDEEDIILAENKNELVVKPAAKQMTIGTGNWKPSL